MTASRIFRRLERPRKRTIFRGNFFWRELLECYGVPYQFWLKHTNFTTMREERGVLTPYLKPSKWIWRKQPGVSPLSLTGCEIHRLIPYLRIIRMWEVALVNSSRQPRASHWLTAGLRLEPSMDTHPRGLPRGKTGLPAEETTGCPQSKEKL